MPATASATLQNALKDGFGEAVAACDMPEPASFRLLTVARRASFGLTRKFIFSPHPVVCLVLQVGDVEMFPQALGFESLNPFFSRNHRGGWR